MGYLWGASLWNVLIERAFYVIAWYTVFFIKMRACILPDDAIMIDLGFLFLFLLYEFTFLFTYFVATGCKEWSRSIHAERIIFLEWQEKATKLALEDTDTKLVEQLGINIWHQLNLLPGNKLSHLCFSMGTPTSKGKTEVRSYALAKKAPSLFQNNCS